MAKPFRHALTVFRISLEEVLDLPSLNVPGYSPHARDNISDQPSLQHLVWRKAYARHDVGQRKGGLLNLDLTRDDPMQGRGCAV
jgi:hypothetical protein